MMPVPAAAAFWYARRVLTSTTPTDRASWVEPDEPDEPDDGAPADGDPDDGVVGAGDADDGGRDAAEGAGVVAGVRPGRSVTDALGESLWDVTA
jgi:hypothetical protein